MKLPTLIFLLALGAIPLLGATSTVPTLLSYQGTVTDTAGVPIGNSASVNRTVLFKLYSTAAGGTPIWAESQVVTISGGAFSVIIGNGTGISELPGPSSPATPVKAVTAAINGAAAEGVYLGVSVSDGTSAAPVEISPRQRLVSAAYAARAVMAETVAPGGITATAIADGEITANKLGSGVVDNSKLAGGAVHSNSILDGSILAADIATGTITADKFSSTIGLWATDSTGLTYYGGDVKTGKGNSALRVNGALNAQSQIASHWQGAYLEWNKPGGGGRTYLLNQKGGGSGGIVFGEVDTGNTWTESVFFSPDGKVGIGQMDPGFPLNFSNTLGDKISLYGNISNSFGFGVRNNLLQIHTDVVWADVAFGYGSSASDTSMTEVMRIKGNGNVGIGTNSPTEKLTIANGWINFAAADGAESGIKGSMAANDAWAIYGTGSNNNGALVIKTYDDATEPIQFVQSNNYRGGFNSAGDFELNAQKFQINSSRSGQPAYVQIYHNESAMYFMLYNGGRAGQRWQGFSFDGDNNWDFQSDRRLKKDIQDAEPMLDRLMQVQFRRYHYLSDAPEAKLEFGVIAQELQPHFPLIVGESLDRNSGEMRLTVGLTEFATIAAKAVQELKIRHDVELDELKIRTGDLENRLEEKDAVIAALAARLSVLEARLSPSK